jgi:hypothetical protein
MRQKIYGRGKAILPIIILLVLCKPVISLADDITFSSSGTIGPNDVYDWVYLENDGTVVDMTGGLISDLFTISPYYTTFNMMGGTISNSASLNGASVFTMNGGNINGDIFFESGTRGYFYDGIVLSSALKVYSDAALNITDGDVSFNSISIDGILNLSGGIFDTSDSYINYYSADPAAITIYGYGFNYDPTGGAFGGGILTGYLLDDSPFSFDNLHPSEYACFNLVPEPATLLLFCVGGLLLRKRI